MASATVVGLGGQLALCPAASSAAGAGPTRAAAQASGSSSRARLLLGGRALPQLRSRCFTGVAQVSTRRLSVFAEDKLEVDASEAAKGLSKSVQDYWEKADDKLALGGLGVAGLLVLWASTGLISAVNKVPFIAGIFEFVGIVGTGWFIYRYLLFKPSRQELLKIIEEAKGKITGEI